MTLHTIKGVEFFKAGKWNGDSYSVEDLDAMVAAFDKVGYRPAVTLGHVKEPGAPAVGWVSRIWRKGSTLLADFVDVADEVYQLIRRRAYDFVSAEIYWDVERNGHKFSRALRAIALLGAHPPGVSDLKPLREVVNRSQAECRIYTFPFSEEDDDMTPAIKAMQRANAHGDAFVAVLAELQREHPSLSAAELYQLAKASPKGSAALRAYAEQGVVKK